MKRLAVASVALGILLKLVILLNARSIGTDGTYYATLGNRLLLGDGIAASREIFPPFYPATFAALYRLTGGTITDDAALYAVPMEWAARVVSAACGLLLIWPLYRLTHDLFGPTVAYGTVCCAALHTAVNRHSGEVRTETMGAFLAITAVWLAWRGFRMTSPIRLALSGLLVGLAYLTRPEMAGLVGLISGWVFLAVLWDRPNRWRHLALCGLPVLMFLLVALPYMYNLSLRPEVDGRWSLSAKTGLFYNNGMLAFALDKLGRIPSDLFEYFGKEFLYSLLPFFFVGLVYRRRVPRNRIGERYLLLIIVAFFFVLPSGHARFYFTFCVLGFPFAVIGIIEVIHRLARSAERIGPAAYRRRVVRLTGIAYLAVLIPGIITATQPINAKREAERVAAAMITQSVRQQKIGRFVVYGIYPDAAYYTGGTFVKLEDREYLSNAPKENAARFRALLEQQDCPVFILVDTHGLNDKRKRDKYNWLIPYVNGDDRFASIGQVRNAYRDSHILVYEHR